MNLKRINPLRKLRAIRAARKKPLIFKTAQVSRINLLVSDKIFFTTIKLLKKYPYLENGRALPGRMSFRGRKMQVIELIKLLVPDKKLQRIVLNSQISDTKRLDLYEQQLMNTFGSKEKLLALLLKDQIHKIPLQSRINFLTREIVKQKNMQTDEAYEFKDKFLHSIGKSISVLEELDNELQQRLLAELGFPKLPEMNEEGEILKKLLKKS